MTKTLEHVPGFDVSIFQDTQLFRSSIDSVLLTHWVQIKPRQHLVDLCSGSGIIGLCLAQKFQTTTHLFEIQEALAQLAQESINYNHLQPKVQLINANINKALDYLTHDSVDVITCNPPYFSPTSHQKLGKSISQNIARHELFFNQELLAKTASSLLKDNGSLYLVYRPDRLLELSYVLQKFHLPIKELLFVHPHSEDLANLVLIKCRKTMRINGLKAWPDLIIYNNDGTYTKQLREFVHV
ncbi:tRNA1(Val) (adenine(37)-N6)-methyltransferase [Bombilactobacillus bombi]|uniref:tRNA1(Val) (adenine(37)-N6)-methyltransferase n=1 Tax=Bombilactobacillus bombi TaxID=1303590 RepID=UPI0015E5EBCD|nr:methyltransferase [Bombilactobacillus bombi]MBA1434820.1 methyltransferase domain-containing protein [Bombilactobacillus bombi]